MYEYPYVTKYIRKVNCCSYFPLSPTFDKEINCSCCSKQEESLKSDHKGEYQVTVSNGSMQDVTVEKLGNGSHQETMMDKEDTRF